VTQDPTLYLTLAASGLAGLGMVVTAGLAGWRGWLALKRDELGAYRPLAEAEPAGMPSAGSRIEIADLKERIRKLEAIAAGVDL
jgi:thioredoxin reductase